jgi:ABC-type bacteriocin/lantibiotic exporter with double-glycine peptidase domain
LDFLQELFYEIKCSNMDWNDLTSEEQEIVNRYRQLTPNAKKAVLQSQNSFISWARGALKRFWEKYGDIIMDKLIEGVFTLLTRVFL